MKKKVRKKRKLKKSVKIIMFIIIIFISYKAFYKFNPILSVSYNNNLVLIKLKNIDEQLYCIMSDSTPQLRNENWILSKNNTCEIEYLYGNNNIYIKNEDKIIYLNDKLYYIEPIDNDAIYLSNNSKYDLFNVIIGNINKLKVKFETNNIANIDNNGQLIPKSLGQTKIEFNFNKKHYSYNLLVTDLITSKTISNKQYLPCNEYNKEENDLLDEILKSRINDAGYKTRAGVVEAARFLTLEFPYKINYFYENGRISTSGIDGEGRYYHEGLYLSEDRYDLLNKSSIYGPATWGCSLKSVPISKYIDNGLDCSGFVTWALVNGGFDSKDIGAGFTDSLDLTNLGSVKKITKSLISSGKIKVGDLLHNEEAGGHIAIIIGIDEEYYYVAQAIWYDETGVVITKIKKENLSEKFPHVILMDDYYIEDGNLTNMW